MIIIFPLIIIGAIYFLYRKQISEYFYKKHIIYWSENVSINFSDYQKTPDFNSQLKIVDHHSLYLSSDNIEKAYVRAIFNKNRSWVKDSTDFNVDAVKKFQKLRFDLYEIYARKFNSEIDKIRHNPKTSYNDFKNIGDRIYQELKMFEDEIYIGDYSTQERVEIWEPKVEKLLKESKNYR